MIVPAVKPVQATWSFEKLRVLDLCQHIHKHAEELYQYLAEIHKDQGEIARIWGLLAVDKCNHSDTFKMASRMKGEGIKDIAVTPETATNILVKMKTILKGIKHKRPSVLDALSFAIKMEESLNSVHFRHVVTFVNEQDLEMITSPLRSNASVVHMITEEYVNMTLME